MTPFSPPDGYRHHLPMQIRWGDMDALGHVNNATYLTYLEQARLTYFNDMGLWDASISQLGLIMAKVVLEYKLPLASSDEIHVFTRCTRLGNKSFDTEQVIIRRTETLIEVAAQATITIVVFDYQANRSAPLPQAWRAKLIAYEPEVIAGS